MFQGLADQAAEHASAENQQTTNIDNGSSYDSNPMSQELNLKDHQEAKHPEQQTPTSVHDLAKLDKFLVDGKEMTFKELKSHMLRHEDYTKKTQELAKQRQEIENFRREQAEEQKFSANYETDLRKVLSNPEAYLNKFLEIYPRKWHDQLFQDLEKNSQNPQSGQQAFDSRYLQLMRDNLQIKETLTSYENQRNEERLASIDQTLETKERALVEKYPQAHMGDVYTALQKFAKENNINIQTMGQKAMEQMTSEMEKLAKFSHEQFEKRAMEYQKTLAKRQIEANKKGSDIGRGGGTPTQAPQKMKLNRVADYMIGQMKDAGEL